MHLVIIGALVAVRSGYIITISKEEDLGDGIMGCHSP